MSRRLGQRSGMAPEEMRLPRLAKPLLEAWGSKGTLTPKKVNFGHDTVRNSLR
jgi:hypothetical protein